MEDITWWRENMNFIFSWQKQYFTHSPRSFVKYCFVCFAFGLKQKSIAEPGALDQFQGSPGALFILVRRPGAPLFWVRSPGAPNPLGP